MLADGISIIICCYNSAWIIQQSLSALKKQAVPTDFKWEVLIVNNLCTDNTVEIVQSCLENSNIDYRIIDETKAGLLYARQRGINEARYMYSIFCDDDNLLDPSYVYGMYEVMRTHPDCGAAGGTGLPKWEVEPHVLISSYPDAYACGDQSANRYTLFGAGLCVRTQLVKDIYDSQPFYLVGRCGDKLFGGDDGELVMSIILKGYHKRYVSELTFVHMIPKKRLSLAYFYNLFKGFALMTPVVNVYIDKIANKPFVIEYVKYLLLYVYLLSSLFERETNRRELLRIKYWNTIKAYHYWTFKRLQSIYSSIE